MTSKDFFENTLPIMQQAALGLREKVSKQHLHYLTSEESQLIIPRDTIYGILSLEFFFGFESCYSKTVSKYSHFELPPFPRFTFKAMNKGDLMELLKCLLHYFTRARGGDLKGNVGFYRVSKKPVAWDKSTTKLCSVIFVIIYLTLSAAEFQADFANRYLGGGALEGGCVQEELLFAVKPECIAGMFFCTVMQVQK